MEDSLSVIPQNVPIPLNTVLEAVLRVLFHSVFPWLPGALDQSKTSLQFLLNISTTCLCIHLVHWVWHCVASGSPPKSKGPQKGNILN